MELQPMDDSNTTSNIFKTTTNSSNQITHNVAQISSAKRGHTTSYYINKSSKQATSRNILRN